MLQDFVESKMAAKHKENWPGAKGFSAANV